MNYPEGLGAPECYLKACSNFREFNIEIEKGDYIFPYEGDVFHHEKDQDIIQGYMDQLSPNTGFTSTWIDFLETQYYCERSTLKPLIEKIPGRHRRVCIKFGTWEFYKEVLLNFMTQKYPMLHPTDLITYHYAWWRPEKYKQLRFDQLNRNPQYWVDFNKGLEKIKEIKNTTKEDVVIRPDSPENRTHRYASYYKMDRDWETTQY